MATTSKNISIPDRSPGFTMSSRSPHTPPPSATRLRGYPLRRRASSSSLRSSVSEASVESSELDWTTGEDDDLHRLCDEYANESTHTPYAGAAPPNQLVHHLAKTARRGRYGDDNDRWRHTLRSTRKRINMIMREDAPPLYTRMEHGGIVKSRSTPNTGLTSPHPLISSQRLVYTLDDEKTPRKILANITAGAYYSPDKSGLRQALGSITIAAPMKSEQPIRRSARHAAISLSDTIDEEANDGASTPKVKHTRRQSSSPVKRLATEINIDDGLRLGLRPRKRQNSVAY
ncbi:hypothetical protein E3Q18_03076 [Wallemia mellicola]|nr:hypothetical protein E3Q18_03076 [Wallemia mellicola]